jgi:hypothetical protein
LPLVAREIFFESLVPQICFGSRKKNPASELTGFNMSEGS